ncbi:arginase family protein [Pseudonocardia acaciae]|uniref:arginase family protein n=1 Tax=Pseudonocardia acaciae TaxID=551276 RepID=UPI00048D3513|nr:arginase family protein [Pseudonocardia acaciae]
MTVVLVPFHLDTRLPRFESPVPTDLTVDPELPDGTPWERMAALYENVAATVAETQRPMVVSGDCTTSMGVVAGLQRAGVEPSIVWFDAHGDVQTPETSTSGYLGGMPLRQIVGGADRTVAEHIGLRPVPESDVVLVDARDLDPPEVEYLSGAAVRHVPIDALPIPDGPTYLHIDVDVVDERDLPGLLFPVAAGPRLPEVAAAVRSVLAAGNVVAIGLACTWKPGAGAEKLIAGLAAELA